MVPLQAMISDRGVYCTHACPFIVGALHASRKAVVMRHETPIRHAIDGHDHYLVSLAYSSTPESCRG